MLGGIKRRKAIRMVDTMRLKTIRASAIVLFSHLAVTYADAQTVHIEWNH